MKLLQAGHFDVLVTDDYAADLYIGDLIERAASLPSPPQVYVLSGDSTAAGQPIQSLGLCTILEKTGAARTFASDHRQDHLEDDQDIRQPKKSKGSPPPPMPRIVN